MVNRPGFQVAIVTGLFFKIKKNEMKYLNDLCHLLSIQMVAYFIVMVYYPPFKITEATLMTAFLGSLFFVLVIYVFDKKEQQKTL